MDEVLRSTQSKITATITGADGEPANADAGVTVTIRDSAGVVLVDAAAASDEAGVGVYGYTLSAAQTAILDRHDAVWDASVASQTVRTRTSYEVVGAALVSVADVRAFDAELTADRYSTAKMQRAIAEATERFEALAGVAFRPRGSRERLSGTGVAGLFVAKLFPRVLVAASVDEVTLTVAEIGDVTLHEHGELRRGSGVWPLGHANVEVFYEHGRDVAPEPVRDAVLELVRERLVPSAIPPRATSVDTDIGSFRLSIADREHPTGIPYVDQVLASYGLALPAIG